MYACFLRCHKSASYILTLTAGRKGEEDISLLPEGTHLPGEYLLKAIVVADGRQAGSIHRKRQSRQGGTIEGKPSYKFRGNMLRIASDTKTVTPVQPKPAAWQYPRQETAK